MLQNLKSAKLRILNPGQLICEAQVTFKLAAILMIISKVQFSDDSLKEIW